MERLSNIENALLAAADPPLAWGALIASGVKTLQDIEDYLEKVQRLCGLFENFNQDAPGIGTARNLFLWLWTTKPARYEPGGSFKLNECLDAQLDPEKQSVGNCLGLAVLFNALAEELTIRTRAVYLEEAFRGIPHVFSVIELDQTNIEVEHTLRAGFDFKGHHSNLRRLVWNNKELIADIYHSRGNLYFEYGDLEKGLENYTRALALNPAYTRARLNRGIALTLLDRYEEARSDLAFAQDT